MINVLLHQAVLQSTCAFTLVKNHRNAKCVINVSLYQPVLQSTWAFIQERNNTSGRSVISIFLYKVISGNIFTFTQERIPRCYVCAKHFAAYDVYQKHMPIHSGEQPYKCNICAEQFSHVSNLHSHIAPMHSAAELSSLLNSLCYFGMEKYSCMRKSTSYGTSYIWIDVPGLCSTSNIFGNYSGLYVCVRLLL